MYLRSIRLSRLPDRALRIARAYATDSSPSQSDGPSTDVSSPSFPMYNPSTPSTISKPSTYNKKRPFNRVRQTGHISRASPPPHLLTLADLSPDQIASLLKLAIVYKHLVTHITPLSLRVTLTGRTVAMLFNKRSTRTRVASETAVNLLGGSGMFLGSSDIQLGVNETLEDSVKIIGGMADGIMARVNDHADVEVGSPDFSKLC